MIKCNADIIECLIGWQAEFHPFAGMDITTWAYPTKEILKQKVEKQAKKLNIEIIWNE